MPGLMPNNIPIWELLAREVDRINNISPQALQKNMMDLKMEQDPYAQVEAVRNMEENLARQQRSDLSVQKKELELQKKVLDLQDAKAKQLLEGR